MSAQSESPVIFDGWVAGAKSKNETLVRNIVLILGLTALTALCAQVSIPLPFTPVPLTLQTFAVLGGAAALGAERAVLAQTLYVGLAWAGLPILAELVVYRSSNMQNIYILGVGWLAHSTGMSLSAAISAGMIPFLIGDVLKALVAGALLPSVWKVLDSK